MNKPGLFKRVIAIALLFLLLLPAIPLDTMFASHNLIGEASAATAPISGTAKAIRLTNTTYDNFFLPSLESAMPSLSFTDRNFGNGGRARASSGGVVAWDNYVTDLGSCSSGATPAIGISALNSTTGVLYAKNISVPEGYRLTACSIISNSIPNMFALDDGNVYVGVTNLATNQPAILHFDGNDGTTTIIQCPNPRGAACGISAQPISTWGSYAITLKEYPRFLDSSYPPPPTLYSSTEISAYFDHTWQQLTPSDWTVIDYKCSTSTDHKFLDPVFPTQVMARGPGQYVWTRVNNVIKTGTQDCSEPYLSPTSGQILLEDGTIVANFPSGSGSYQGTKCSWDYNDICDFGLVGAWGNIILYKVQQPGWVDAYYVYDVSRGTTTMLPATWPGYGIWSDGESLIMENSVGGGLPDQIILYQQGAITLFNQKPVEGEVRVSNGWALWGNSTGYLNFFNESTHKLYSLALRSGDANTPLLAPPEFADGVAAWVVLEPNPASASGGSKTPSQIPVLYTLKVSDIDPSTGNTSAAATRTILDFARAGPLHSTTLDPNGQFHVSGLIVSNGWIFLSMVPLGSGYYQIFAFQPLVGSVGVTVNGSFLPLKEVRVDVTQYVGGARKLITTTYTDDDGKFSVLLPQSISTANPSYVFEVNMTQRDGRFMIMDYSGNRSANPPTVTNSVVVVRTSDLNAIRVTDNFVKLDIMQIASFGRMGTTASRVAYAADAAYNYYLTFQAYQLLRDYLNSANMIDQTLQVRLFSSSPGTFFSWSGYRTGPYLNISPKDSRIGALDAPMNTIWHEFGHAVMWYSPIGGTHNMPQRKPGDPNHGGYRNSISTDAWIEGWAEFYSSMVAQYVDHRVDAQMYKWGGAPLNLDGNPKVWNPWPREEVSVAGTLWDLVNTETIPDNDYAHIPLPQLWQTLTTVAPTDMQGVYSAFKGLDGVNQTFIAHDIYNDTDHNGRWDFGDPIGITSWAVIKTFAISGTGQQLAVPTPTTDPILIKNAVANNRIIISNLNRGNRHDMPVAPGSTILVNLTDSVTGAAIDGLIVYETIVDPPNPIYVYNFTLPSGVTTFNLSLPDANASASITVSALGYNSTRSYSVSGPFFTNSVITAMLANSTGSYLLQITGTLGRNSNIFRTYSIDASSATNDYAITLSTNGAVSGQAYSAKTSTVTFTEYGPTSNGQMVVTVPMALNNGTFSVTINNSPVKFTLTRTSIASQLSFTIPPGQSFVTITISPASTTTTSTSKSTSGVPPTSTSQTVTGPSSSTYPGGGGIEFPNQLIALVVFAALVIIPYLFFKRRKQASKLPPSGTAR